MDRKLRKTGQELTDLDVDRVDGVDRPATGRAFLLFKSEDGNAEQVAKDMEHGYALVATAASNVLKAVRKDTALSASKSTAIALNGLAQVFKAEPIFVSKAVPTQPYEFTEPDVWMRGPADEKLGPNFTPRSMPGSMVGKAALKMKDEDDEDSSKTKLKSLRKQLAKAYKDEDDDAAKSLEKQIATASMPEATAKAKPAGPKVLDDPDDDADMGASEKANRGIARSIEKMALAVSENTAVLKALATGEPLEKSGDVKKVVKSEEDPDKAERVIVKSRQAVGEERVRKSEDETRMGVSFANVVFPKV